MELKPTTTAVLALHWQNDIVSRDGKFAPTFSAEATRNGVVARTAELLTAARQAGALVVYTRVCFRPGYPDLVANGPLLAGCQAAGALVDGEWGADILDDLEPRSGDLVVSHRRISGLWGSDLHAILQARGVTTLLLTGVATNFTVLNTAFDAVNAGYTTTVVSDCCSAADAQIHDVAVHTIEVIGFSTTAADAARALAGQA
ncbi:MAG: cysteine hydrolase family protein [Vicinamibacterales bacterium]